jgi:hypothetical protein
MSETILSRLVEECDRLGIRYEVGQLSAIADAMVQGGAAGAHFDAAMAVLRESVAQPDPGAAARLRAFADESRPR